MKLRIGTLSLLAAAGVSFTGCATDSAPTPASHPASRIAKPHPQPAAAMHADQTRFNKVMAELVTRIKANPSYRKIGLKTPEQKRWFKQLLYKLWHRDITRAQFVAEGTKRYPDKRYEFSFIAEAMQEI